MIYLIYFYPRLTLKTKGCYDALMGMLGYQPTGQDIALKMEKMEDRRIRKIAREKDSGPNNDRDDRATLTIGNLETGVVLVVTR